MLKQSVYLMFTQLTGKCLSTWWHEWYDNVHIFLVCYLPMRMTLYDNVHMYHSNSQLTACHVFAYE